MKNLVVLIAALAATSGAAAQGMPAPAVAIQKEAKVGRTAPLNEECEPGPHLPGVQCFAAQRKVEDMKVAAAYEAALKSLPEKPAWDARKGRAQLSAAQAAWLTYREEHCAVVGAMEGGSNMSVTFNSLLCESHMASERIAFLRWVESGNAEGDQAAEADAVKSSAAAKPMKGKQIREVLRK